MGRRKMTLILLTSLAGVTCGVVIYYALPKVYSIDYANPSVSAAVDSSLVQGHSEGTSPNVLANTKIEPLANTFPISHILTPSEVKAVYLSSWVAGSSKYRNPIISLVDSTQLNAVIIDIKDSTGRIGFRVFDPEVQKEGSVENRIADIHSLVSTLHQKNIYIIGRVAVFQDPYMTKKRPEWAITRKSDGAVWKDRKGLSFLDPANADVHKYIVGIARDAYAQGFDEINFDYIRYPSDGNISDINYHLAAGKTRADNLEHFFKYLFQEMKKDQNIPMSADLFGLTTEAADDMGIGQVWEKALPYFDFLAPMVYPSHYPAGHNGYKNPAAHPYEIILHAMQSGITKTKKVNQDIHKIRPWIQDFNLGAVYTKDMIHQQMQAVYDSGLNSWMIWDPNNKYKSSALELEDKP